MNFLYVIFLVGKSYILMELSFMLVIFFRNFYFYLLVRNIICLFIIIRNVSKCKFVFGFMLYLWKVGYVIEGEVGNKIK